MSVKEQLREKLLNKIIDWHEHSSRRIYISVDHRDLIETVEFIFKVLGLRFVIASGQDTPRGLEILYHFSDDKTGEIFSLRVLIENKENPEIDSIAALSPAAEWIEREMWELLGINFKGHPNLKRLLLAEDWPQGEYPLRKKS